MFSQKWLFISAVGIRLISSATIPIIALTGQLHATLAHLVSQLGTGITSLGRRQQQCSHCTYHSASQQGGNHTSTFTHILLDFLLTTR
jgi:hypothetical protein